MNLDKKAKELEERIRKLEILHPLLISEKQRELCEKLYLINEFENWKEKFIKKLKEFLPSEIIQPDFDFNLLIWEKIDKLAKEELTQSKQGENKK